MNFQNVGGEAKPSETAYKNNRKKGEAALEEVKIAIELWLETAKREGSGIPQPQGKELLNTLYENFQRCGYNL